MSELCELELLLLDCQAGGATPAHGDLLEIGWARAGPLGTITPVQSRWIVPRTGRRIGRAVRELTGWSEALLTDSVAEHEAWNALRQEIAGMASGAALVPAAIHFARFELPFLRDLHERLAEPGEFPLDTICLHAVAQRLFPDLPRRNIRALAGYLGHSPELMRRSAGHVEATAFIWQALVPRLESLGVHSWSELKAWLSETSPGPRRTRRVFPLPAEVRRALPDAPGVYRFVRSNGDVLYVGKATSLKKRVASHFKSRGPATERGLELLSQVHDIRHSETPSLLEAALLEADEIKRLDPPYNVQLRAEDRMAWFVARNLRDAAPAPDDAHRIGPLPSRRALAPLGALIELLEGAEATTARAAGVLCVPQAFLPEAELFAQGFREFVVEHLPGREGSPTRRVTAATRNLWLIRGRAEAEPAGDDTAPDAWDLARVRRRLERNFLQSGLLLRRSRWLCLLVDARVAFLERGANTARALVIRGGQIVESREVASLAALAEHPGSRALPLGHRQSCFDAATYDRLRVLVTELCRIHFDGGEVALYSGRHALLGERLRRMMREI